MKALVLHGIRDLRLEEHAPAPLGRDQVEVSIQAGGICGTDLHYYQDGGFGTIRLRQPMILGHEVAGSIRRVGPEATRFKVGDRVAISPSLPCESCRFCQAGMHNHCLDMQFYGSAMPMPHIQGAFRQRLVVEESQCHAVHPQVSIEEAALAEPLAVVLHALSRAGSLLGKRVLVTGCGPIGILCVIAARAHGARLIVATDMVASALRIASRVGADRVIDVSRKAADLDAYGSGKGHFDVLFEASGSAQAVESGISVLAPRGVLVQLGLGETLSIPQTQLVAGEIELRGSFRFHHEFALAVDLINRRRLDVSPLLTGVFAMEDSLEAFKQAADRTRSMKVQIRFESADLEADWNRRG